MSEPTPHPDWERIDHWPGSTIWRHRETRRVWVALGNYPWHEWQMTQGEAARLGRALLNAAGVTR